MASAHRPESETLQGQHCCADPTHHHEPAPTGVRAAVERASVPVLRALTRVPAWLPFLAMLVLMLVGGVVGGVVGAVLLGVAVLVVAWLLYLAWPRLTGVERLMRVAVLALVVAVALTTLLPR